MIGLPVKIFKYIITIMIIIYEVGCESNTKRKIVDKFIT